MLAGNQLGYAFDLTVGINPIADIAAGANTGKRVHMRNYDTFGVLFVKNAASAGTDTVTLTLRQHTAASAGTSADLAAIKDWYAKSTAAALAGTETWTERTQAAAATLALTNAIIPAANQAMVYFDINAGACAAGYEWLSVDIGDPGSGGTIMGAVYYILGGLKMGARPDRLANPNT